MALKHKKKTGRFLDDGEISPVAKVFIGLGFLFLLSVGGAIAGYFVSLKNEGEKFDKVTFCPKDGPESDRKSLWST